jgi:hypothetical protein
MIAMALLTPTNCTVNIYRTANPASPYTLGTLSASNVKAFLEPAVQNGRFGSASGLKWTHILLLPSTVDIRDAYNSQLDPGRDNTLADTVVLTDSILSTTKVAFYVAFVEQIGRGSAYAHLRAYLDRFQPNTWPTDAL